MSYTDIDKNVLQNITDFFFEIFLHFGLKPLFLNEIYTGVNFILKNWVNRAVQSDQNRS